MNLGGGAGGIRTLDPLNAIEVRSHCATGPRDEAGDGEPTGVVRPRDQHGGNFLLADVNDDDSWREVEPGDRVVEDE